MCCLFVVCNFFLYLFCSLRYIVCVVFKSKIYFWSSSSIHMNSQYWAFAFNFDENDRTMNMLKMKLKKKTRMTKSSTIMLDSSRFVTSENFSTMSHCFMRRNHVSWLCRVKKDTKRRFVMKSLMMKISSWKKEKKNQNFKNFKKKKMKKDEEKKNMKWLWNLMWVFFIVVCDSTRRWSSPSTFSIELFENVSLFYCRFALWATWSSVQSMNII